MVRKKNQRVKQREKKKMILKRRSSEVKSCKMKKEKNCSTKMNNK
jgi:hypothetical protein